MPIAGNTHYLVSKPCEPLARIRLDETADISTQDYGEKQTLDGVSLSFHPAGHILGSAQVRVEYKGEVWVISGGL
jgi:putative mRNA 3-end processing factor